MHKGDFSQQMAKTAVPLRQISHSMLEGDVDNKTHTVQVLAVHVFSGLSVFIQAWLLRGIRCLYLLEVGLKLSQCFFKTFAAARRKQWKEYTP